MSVFRLKHPDSNFRGTAGGVDFWNGYGTTSSIQDVQNLVRVLGCQVFLEEKQVEVLEKKTESGTTALSFKVLEQAKDEKKEGDVEPSPLPIPEQPPPKPKKPKPGRHKK